MDTEKLNVKKGIERLARVYCWPNDPVITDKDKYEFNALCEFVVFKEFIMDPFFRSLSHYSYKHIAKLYQHLSSLPMDKTHMLTYKEAYLFMRYLYFTGNDIVKSILEQISCPLNIYNGIIRSLEEENYNLFFSALEKSDFTMMMQVLWLMRYILLGEKGSWNNINPSIPHLKLLPYLPRRINNFDNYRPYFEVREDDDEGILLDERIIRIVHGRLRKIRRLNRKSSPSNDSNSTIEGGNIIELERFFDESLFKTQWKELLTEYTDNSDSLIRNNRVNTAYMESLAKLILARNIFLHKKYVMEKYGITSSEVFDDHQNSIDILYANKIETKDLGRFILYYTYEMLDIYYKLEDILPEKRSFDRVKTYALRNNIEIDKEKIINIHDDRLSQIRLLKRDTAPEHQKWFVNVLDSKIPTKESDKNQILYDCLSQLFDKLCDLGCMSSENDNKKVFIYRFSGFNNAYPLDRKIQWKGSNTLLGYITRCLTSDKVNRPMVFGKVASFFDSESEKKMNLASAKNIMVDNYEEKKNALPPDFIKAVELLRKCGFVNVEFTSPRR